MRRIRVATPLIPQAALPPGTAGKILTTALTMFAEHGFYGTSIRDIAAAIGIRPATIYGHWSSKEHVLAALVAMGHELLLDGLRAAVLAADADPVSRLRAIVREHVLMHCEYTMLAVVIDQEMHALPAGLAAPALALRRQAEALAADVLLAGASDSTFDIEHPWVTGAAIAGMGMRVARWYEPSCPLTPEQVADAHADLALRMVGVGDRRVLRGSTAPIGH